MFIEVLHPNSFVNMCAEIIFFLYYQSDLNLHCFLLSNCPDNLGRNCHHLQIEIAIPTKASRVNNK